MTSRRRQSKPVGSRRYLVLRHAKAAIQARAWTGTEREGPQQHLAAGYEQLFSSHVPGLHAGKYKIDITQEIQVTRTSEPKATTVTSKNFDVLAPRFVLAPDCVYSTFPAPGSSALAETLAHVVLNDTTLPWERGFDAARTLTTADDTTRNCIPWLACLTFETNELLLTEQQLGGGPESRSIFSQTSRFSDGIKQSSTLSVKLDIPDFLRLDQTQVVHPYRTVDGESQPRGELIFVKPELFNYLFTNLDRSGEPAAGQTHCSVSRYQYLAHVRYVNTEGMAVAGEDDEAFDRHFAVIPSHRSGPPGLSRPTQLVSHLVSIEGIEKMANPVDPSKLVALPSLHSWAHTCLPDGSFRLADALEHLGETQGMLRPPSGLIPKIDTSFVLCEIAKRMEDGFSMLRWRTIEGDTTAAFTRSPFVPKVVAGSPRETLSNSGHSLQILDHKTGIMDLTYSAAWNLGRTLAMADQSFTASLCRVRKEILRQATDKVRRAVLYKTGNSVMEWKHLVPRLADLVSHLAQLPIAPESDVPEIDLAQRWCRTSRPLVEVSYHRNAPAHILEAELRHAAFRIGGSVNSSKPRIFDDDEEQYGQPYDEYNQPFSADWAVVHKFVLDLLFLVGVPMHYLVTDASHLPTESLCFFHIDPNWTEALVDGALCLGNLVDDGKDRVRKAMKETLDRYRSHVNPEVGYAPVVPTYGFLLRSAVVREFPDLVISTQPVRNREDVPLIARQEIVDTDTMLVLLTESPGTAELEFLTFSQPAHQQCFTAAKSLTREAIELSYRRIYTTADHRDPDMKSPFNQAPWKRTGEDALNRSRPYIWGTAPDVDDLRILNVEHLAKNVYETLKNKLNTETHTWFNEIGPTAAMLGIQLNDPCWQLKIKWPNAVPTPPTTVANSYPIRKAAAPVHKKAVPDQSVRHFSFAQRCAFPLLYMDATPPHFAAIRPTRPLPGWSAKQPPNYLSGTPEYNYRVYPASEPGKNGVSTAKEPQDLIFSILYKRNAFDFQLQRLIIDIPVGDDTKVCLAQTYQGSGTFMLSNMRMNVLPTYSSSKKMLRIEIVPRSHWGFVGVKNLKEMSFMLSGVEVSRQYPGDVDVKCDVVFDCEKQPLHKTDFTIKLRKMA